MPPHPGNTAPSEPSLTYPEGLAKIANEHSLINNRLTWLILMQAALLTSYFTVRHIDIAGAAETGIDAGIIRLSIMSCGILFDLAVAASVFAAFIAIRRWRSVTEREKREYLTSKFSIHFFGDLPAAMLPVMIFLIWIAVGIYDQSTLRSVIGEYLIFAVPFTLLTGWSWYSVARRIFFKEVEAD